MTGAVARSGVPHIMAKGLLATMRWLFMALVVLAVAWAPLRAIGHALVAGAHPAVPYSGRASSITREDSQEWRYACDSRQPATQVYRNFTTGAGELLAGTQTECLRNQDGSRLTDSRWTYTWDAENRLKSMECAPGTHTNAPAPGWRLTFTYDGLDRLGNITGYRKAVANTPAAELRAVFESDAFGRELFAAGTAADKLPFRFIPKFTDAETGLNYYGYYDPRRGRRPGRNPSLVH